MTWVTWNLDLVRLEIVLVSLQDRCMIFAKRSEIVLILMQDRCTVCAKRTIGSKFLLDAPDGTPR